MKLGRLGRSRKDPPMEKISAVWRERGEKLVSDNSLIPVVPVSYREKIRVGRSEIMFF
jgi:hypothetical protein